MLFSVVKVIGLAAFALSSPVFAQTASTAPPLIQQPIVSPLVQPAPILAAPTPAPAAVQPILSLAACPVLGSRLSLPVQQSVMSAVQSPDPIMKLQAVRDHYNELLSQTGDSALTLKDQARTLVSFMDNLIASAKLRQQQIRASAPAATPAAAPAARPPVQAPVTGSPASVSPSAPSVGIFQSSYSSQSAVCANLALDSSIEKTGPQSYNLKIKPLDNMEFIDIHFQFNDDAMQQVHKRASDGLIGRQELHVPIKLDANHRNVKYYLTSKAMDKAYQCDTPMYTFDV